MKIKMINYKILVWAFCVKIIKLWIQNRRYSNCTAARYYYMIHYSISLILLQNRCQPHFWLLDSSKAIGLDGIGPRIIKSVANIISTSIASLINKSIATGKFPDKLKVA